MADHEVAVVVGGGPGLSASLVRLFTREGMKAAIAGRNPDKLQALSDSTGCRTYRCDAVVPEEVDGLFARVAQDLGDPNVVVYNASGRVRGPLTELDAGAVRDAIMVTCYGGFLVGQAAARMMLEQGHGTILLTGASASVKGYARSASFAMGKFALRGLAQSMARELAPKNIHVGHFVIDGGIGVAADASDDLLDPDAIAATYLHVHRQHRSAWTWEVELRPWVETF